VGLRVPAPPVFLKWAPPLPPLHIFNRTATSSGARSSWSYSSASSRRILRTKEAHLLGESASTSLMKRVLQTLHPVLHCVPCESMISLRGN
jgi:hypothetical protein